MICRPGTQEFIAQQLQIMTQMQAEQEARARALAQFRETPPAPRPLHPENASGAEDPAGWVRRALRRLRRK